MRWFGILPLVVGANVVLGSMFDVALNAGDAGEVQEDDCVTKNGDVNGDGGADISDAITLLGHLFLASPEELVPLCPVPSSPSGLPDTGQDDCYDEVGSVVDCAKAKCAGQDGFYRGCSNEDRFLDNGDGTVTDNCTGLMWQQDTGNGGRSLHWCEALAYCEGLELAGYDDWRLPSIRELLSIVDYGRRDPAVDPTFGSLAAEYWSSTSDVRDPDRVREVAISSGWPRRIVRSATLKVLAVRNARGEAGGGQLDGCTIENGDVNADGGTDISDAITILGHLFLADPIELAPRCRAIATPSDLPETGQTICYDLSGNVADCAGARAPCVGQDGAYQGGCPNEGRFVDNDDGTVTDNCTGLMWQKVTGNGGMSLIWCEALAYCEGLELAGYDDWRLPSVRELESIVDYGRGDPAVNPAFDALAAQYWSSTAYADASRGVWVVQFSSGYGYTDGRFFTNYVRAVRSGP